MIQPGLDQFFHGVQMAQDRIRQDRADARAYRSRQRPVRQERFRHRRLSVWLGGVFLRWGRALREREGDVDVKIAYASHSTGHSPAA